MGKVLAKSGSHFQFFRSETPATTLAVVFSSRASRPPNFTFWKKFQSLDCHVVYINCPVPEWYRLGIPGIAGGLRGAGRSIEEFSREVGAQRVVAVGSSMGAYGAALFGHFTKFDDMLLFGLEPLLGMPGGQAEVTRNQHMAIYPDLRQVNWGAATVVYGEMDINDVLGAALLYEKSKASLLCLPFAQHDTPEFLDSFSCLDLMFNRLLQGTEVRIKVHPDRHPHADPEIARALWAVKVHLAQRNWKEVDRTLSSFSRAVDRSLTAKYVSAVADYKLHRVDQSIPKFERILETIPLYWEAWLNLANALSKKSLGERAIVAATNAVRLRPHRSIAHFQLATILEKFGNHHGALVHVQFAHRLNNESEAYRKKLIELSSATGDPPTLNDGLQEVVFKQAAREAKIRFGDLDYFGVSDRPPVAVS